MRYIIVCYDSKPTFNTTISSVISSALLLSHNIRRDTILQIHFNNNKVLIVDGMNVRNLRPDYESMKGLVLSAIKGKTKYGIYIKDNRELHSINVEYLLYESGTGSDLVNTLISINVQQDKPPKISYIVNCKSIPDNISSKKRILIYSNTRDLSVKIILFNYILDLLGW